MTRFTDGDKLMGITLNTFENGQYTPDFSADFYNVGSLPYDEEQEACIVPDVKYCIEQAMDWKYGLGDYADEYEGDPGHTFETRNVEVVDLR